MGWDYVRRFRSTPRIAPHTLNLPRAPILAHSQAWHLGACVQIDGTEAKCAIKGIRVPVPRSQLLRARVGWAPEGRSMWLSFPSCSKDKAHPLR